MTFLEYKLLRDRAEAAGIGNDKSLVRLLHYLQSKEVATRHFQAYMKEMEAYCENLSKTIESRIKEVTDDDTD